MPLGADFAHIQEVAEGGMVRLLLSPPPMNLMTIGRARPRTDWIMGQRAAAHDPAPTSRGERALDRKKFVDEE